MFLSNASTRRPVAMSSLLIGLAILGANAYRKIGLELMPQVDIPYITVITPYPGASPEDVEVDVGKPIEDALAGIAGLKGMDTMGLENVCQTMLEFHLGTDVDVAANDVRQKLDAIANDFPAGVETPVIQKMDINAKPIATLCLVGEAGVDELYDYADQFLADQFASLPGVGRVDLIGGANREVVVEIDRRRLAASGLTSLDVLRALQMGLSRLPAGRVRDGDGEITVQYRADFDALDDLAAMQIAGGQGARAYLRDVAHVRLGTEELRQSAFLDGQPAIGLQIVRRSDANTVEVVEQARAVYRHYLQPGRLPGGMRLEWYRDDGDFVRATVNATTFNIVDGIILTAAILFLFLWNARTTMVAAVSMPMTILVGLFAINLWGYTLNIMTLIAIGLSVGVLVSNSIVVLENIESHFRRHGDSWRAAREGTGEVAVAVMASAGTNVVVMFPIALMGGLVGRMFQSFAWTTVAVNAASLFISFTLTPILAACLLKPVREGSLAGLMGPSVNRGLRGLGAILMARLARLGRNRLASAAGVLASFGLMAAVVVVGGSRLGFDMVPEVDNSEINIRLEYPTHQNLETTTRRLLEAQRLLERGPDGNSENLPGLARPAFFTFSGRSESMSAQASEGVYLGQIVIRFKDKGDRGETLFALLEEIRHRLASHGDAIVTAGLTSIMGGRNIPIQLQIIGDDFDSLDGVVSSLFAEARPGGALPEFLSPDTTVREGKPQLRVVPRRAVLADGGFPAADLGLLLRTNLEGTKAGVFRSGARSYDIRVKLAEEEGRGQISDFLFPAADGAAAVPLDTYARLEDDATRVMIARSDKMRFAMFFAQLEPNVSLSAAIRKITSYVRDNQLLPSGYRMKVDGHGEMLDESTQEFAEAAILALIMTFLMLSAILESFRLPLFIYVTIPLGLVGVILALLLTGNSISTFVMLGMVMLVGVVVNNAILVIDRMKHLRSEGMDPGLAMKEAVILEMRAVLMVTSAAALGMWPLANASGLGSELTSGIGWASIGGIAVSSVLIMVVLPLMWWVFYPIRETES